SNDSFPSNGFYFNVCFWFRGQCGNCDRLFILLITNYQKHLHWYDSSRQKCFRCRQRNGDDKLATTLYDLTATFNLCHHGWYQKRLSSSHRNHCDWYVRWSGWTW